MLLGVFLTNWFWVFDSGHFASNPAIQNAARNFFVGKGKNVVVAPSSIDVNVALL